MHGWTGNILHIDINAKKTEIINLPVELYHSFIGGRGLTGHFMSGPCEESWDSPDMPLLLFTGPLVDTPAPTSGRMTIASKSPLTGTVADTSVGGKLGTMIKRAGLDGIIITGKSSNLCGITITDSDISFTTAEDLKGLPISTTLKKTGDSGSTALIGPAAENGVRFSCISVDGHYFSGRSGLGLVMAEKNIKYINVTGTGRTSIYDENEVRGAREEIFRLVSASPILKGEQGISEYGTGALYDLINSRRMMPVNNFKKTYFENATSMNAGTYRKKYQTKKFGCNGCHILCKKKGASGEIMPEYETMSHFSALLGNVEPDIVIEANRLCNDLGMDTISAAATLSCFCEINGTELKQHKLLSALEDIAYSRGHGEQLKAGSKKYAELMKKQSSSIHVKGLELPAYDPRGAYGMALAYCTSTRGGCHLRAYPIAHEILRKPVATDRFTFSGKARIIKHSEDINAVVDSLTACKFIFFAASLEEYSRAFYGVTGVKTSAQELMKAGERIIYNEKMMNAANGFSASDDDLPARFFEKEGTGGEGISIPPLDREAFLKARENYYRVRGLDINGLPIKEKARELGLTWKN